jgi:3'(2'), 5'-bisphosphate nucleotidase
MIAIEKLVDIAREAGKKTLEFYNSEIEVTSKDDDSPLTKADLAAHHYIVDHLSELTDAPIISEESGVPEYEERKEWTKFWLVDPLDGTKEFIKKNGEFTVNIALIDDGVPVQGVVHLPAKDLTYFGEKDKGSFLQEGDKKPKEIYSVMSSKEDPIRVVVSRSHGSEAQEKWIADHNVIETVPSGSSIKLCLVAEGRADVYPRLGPTMEWDVAAGDAVFRYSAKDGVHPSPITYNKKTLKNDIFVVGMEA